MPIGMQQWRVQIGVLEAQRHRYLSRATRKAARRRARGCRAGRINPGKATYSRMVVGIILLGLVVSLSLLLLKAGDVERNPGPLPDEPLSQVDDKKLTGGLDSSQQQLSSAAGLPKTQATSTMANDLSQEESLEFKTVRQHLGKLVATGLNPLTLSVELFSAGLIDQFKFNESTTSDSTDQIKTINLFKAVLLEVERDPGKFHALLQALNEMSSMTQLVQSMKNAHAQGSLSTFPPPPTNEQKLDTVTCDQTMQNVDRITHATLQQHFTDITGSSLDPGLLAGALYQANIINPTLLEKAGKDMFGTQQRLSELLSAVMNHGGPGVFRQFVGILKNTTHSYLGDKLIATYRSRGGQWVDPLPQVCQAFAPTGPINTGTPAFPHPMQPGAPGYQYQQQQRPRGYGAGGFQPTNYVMPMPLAQMQGQASISDAPVPLTVDDVTDVCDILKEARFKVSDWESLAARLPIDDPGSIAHLDQALCLGEVLRQWIHKFKQAVTWEKLATEVSKVSGYGPGTKETILELAAKRGTQFQQQQPTQNVGGVGGPQMMYPTTYQKQTQEPIGGVVWGAGSHMITPGFVPTGAMAYSGMAPQGTQSHQQQQQMMVGRLPGGGGQISIHPVYQQHIQFRAVLGTGQQAMQQQIGFMPPASQLVSTPQGTQSQQQQAAQNVGEGVAGVGGPQMMHPAAYQQQTQEPMGGVVHGGGSHVINPGLVPTGAMAYSGMAPQDLQQSLHNSPTPERTSRLLATTISDESSSMAHLPASRSHQVTSSSSPPPPKRQKLNSGCNQTRATPSDSHLPPLAEQQRMGSGCNQTQAIPSDSHLPPLAGQQRVGSDSPLQVYSNGVKECYKQSHTEVPVQYWPHLKQAKFINLALLKADKFSLSDEYSMGTIMKSADDIYAKKEEVTYSELFASVESGARILIEGRPGCGKTTFIGKVSRDWALGDILKKISVLILVPLQRFHSKPQIRLEDILQLYDPGTLTTPVLDEIISTAGEGVCIAFDGLDEYANSTSEDGFIMDLWHRKLLPRAVVIITSRPAASQKLRPNASRHVEILGFLRKQIVQYVQEYYGNDNEKAKKLLSYLERYKNIRHICYIPLHLAMVVHLNDHLSQRNEPLPRTETEVYLKFTRYILIRDMDRDPTCLSSRLDSLENLPSDRLDAFREICSLAYRGTINSEHIFSQLDAKVLLGVQHINLTSLGLLTVDSQFTDCGLDETYSFFHLTHQEFLGAYYITKLGDEDQVQAFVQYGEERNMSVVWRFYCGLTNAQGNAARDVYKRMIASGKLSALQLLQYTYESHEKSACSELIVSTGGKLILQDESLNPADCSAISFCIQNASHSLTEIELHSCHITSDAFAVFPDEIQSPVSNVRRLCLSHTMVPRKALCSLVKLLKKLPNLQILELTKCTSRLQSTEELVQVLKELQCLNTLSTNMSTAKTFGGVTKLLSDVPTLKSLRIDGSALALEVSRTSDQSSIRLLNAKKETVLIDTLRAADSWTMEIDNLKLTESDVQLLGEAFKQSPTLKTLSLSVNSIGDGGLEGLIQGLQYCTSLQTLELQYNSITDDSADHLAQLGRALPSLTYLNLGRNSIGDRELEGLLEGLQHCSSLQELYLYNTNISDDSVKQLAQFVRDLPSLKTLCIQQNKLSDRGKDVLKQIKKDRPGLIIYT